MALLLKKSTLYYRESTSDPWTPFIMSADANFMAFADEYSASATYAVGEYCRYGGDFWRCTTAITTAEAWDSTHWTKTTIGAEMYLLKHVVLQAPVRTISASGTTTGISLPGLTADHVVGNWGMYSDANCTTPIPENAPTCDITITTGTDSWSIIIANFTSTFYIRPTFILKQN